MTTLAVVAEGSSLLKQRSRFVLVDPITVAAAAPTPALSFSVVRTDGYGSERLDVPNNYGLKFSHSTNSSGDRHYMQITKTLDAVDPYSGLTARKTASVSITANVPKFGFDTTAMVALVKALTDTLADTDVTSTKWLQWGM